MEQMRQRAAEPVQFPDDQAIAGPHVVECLLKAGARIPRPAGLIFKQMPWIDAGGEQTLLAWPAGELDDLACILGSSPALTRWVVRAGGLYEQTPVPDATRTPRLPEVNNAGITFGGTLHVTPKVDLDFSWSHLIPHDAPIALVDPAAGALSGNVRWRTDAVAIGTSFSF